MKSIVYFGIISMLLTVGILSAEAETNSTPKQKNDTTSYTVLTAKVVDESTKKPIVFATVFKTGTSIGTVTNSDGEFELKIPGKSIEGTLSITHLGYKNKVISVKDITSKKAAISLEQHAIPIEEVVIKDIDPEELLRQAILKKKE
ncbi:MAG: carboxypeptidase-like regulatory domain-containing protein, partial [Bacteroidales bacterium]|nr:carboxypeptidase-like regulatory domain-containing protein [Bacteroidales bacterium]